MNRFNVDVHSEYDYLDLPNWGVLCDPVRNDVKLLRPFTRNKCQKLQKCVDAVDAHQVTVPLHSKLEVCNNQARLDADASIHALAA